MSDQVTDGALGRGLMGLGRRAASGLGALAGETLERKRDAMLDVVLGRAAELLGQGAPPAMRTGLVTAIADAALSLRGRELARELRSARPEELVDLVAGQAASWAASAEARPQVVWLIRLALGGDADRPARQVLDELGLTVAVGELVAAWLAVWIAPALESGAIGRWLADLA
jgi:hypothetical protein